jgi:tetratricopeptide (TPR) repeat protein
MTSRTWSPYVGRCAFEARDQDFFFGRDRECRDLKELWTRNRLVVVHGPAGSGKTSLLQAGIPPLLQAEDVLPVGRVTITTSFPKAALPAHNPYTLSVLSTWCPAESSSTLVLRSLTDFLKDRAMMSRWPVPPSGIFVMIDQLEAMFTSAHLAAHREEFFQDIRTALGAIPPLHVLLSVREERRPDLAEYANTLSEEKAAYFFVPPLGREAAVEAVRGPMERVGLKFPPDLAERAVDELGTIHIRHSSCELQLEAARNVEPTQLQVVCQELYRHLPSSAAGVLEVRSWVDRALVSFCGDVVNEVSAEREVDALSLRSWLEQTFVTLGGTRQRVPEGSDLLADMPPGIVRALELRHLLTMEKGAESWQYALASDRLAMAIRKLNRPAPVVDVAGLDAAALLRTAEEVLAEGDLTLAEKHVSLAIKSATDDDLYLQLRALSLLGDIAFEQGGLDLAREHYRRAAEICEQMGDQSGVGRLLSAIGRLHAMQENHTAALEHLYSAVARLRGDLTIQTELANTLLRIGQAQAAAAVFGTVLAIEPDSAEALAGRGQISAESGSVAAALDDLEALRRVRPSLSGRPEVRLAYALALARAGQSEIALEEADAALKFASDNGPAFLRAARVASVTGASERVLGLLRSATVASHPPLYPHQLGEARRLLAATQSGAP